ncbi:type II toxin-antitoxin system HicB family antitoxin [Lysobacter humi (ex Lee et al. 2017)]
MEYVAYVQRDQSGLYRATLPDFPGCVALAGSWLQVEDAVRDAVRSHVQIADLPDPTPIDALSEASTPRDACCMYVRLFAHEAMPPPIVRSVDATTRVLAR